MLLLYSYHHKSASAKALAESLGIVRIKHESSKFKGGPHKTVINWGAHSYPEEVVKCRVLNKLPELLEASNKLNFFKLCEKSNDGPRIPNFTTDPSVALGWLGSNKSVCIRQTVTGSGGAGLSIVSQGELDGLSKAPLYTMYVPKKDEYRVHFVAGKLIDIQKKGIKKGYDKESINWRIRNLESGFIFIRDGIEPPGDVITQATKAYMASALDFGAVDVIYNQKENKAYVLEINTAPGMSPATIASYSKAFREYIT